MGNLFNAHIFKRRSVGEREEVQLKVFDADGNPVDLSAAGSGGGDAGASDPVVFVDLDLTRDASVPSGSRANAIIQNVRKAVGVDGLVAGESNDFVLPAGIYLAWCDGTVNVFNDGTVTDGSWLFGNYTNVPQAFYFDNPAVPAVSGMDSIRPAPFQWFGGVIRIALNNDYEIPEGITGQIRVKLVKVA